MRLHYPSGIRPNWFDRPLSKDTLYYHNTVAPNAYEMKNSHIVPANKRGFIIGVNFYMKRQTAATTAGTAKVGLVIWDTAEYDDVFTMHFRNNNVGEFVENSIPCFIPLNPSEEWSIWAGDISVGGTIEFAVDIIYAEVYK